MKSPRATDNDFHVNNSDLYENHLEDNSYTNNTK